MVFYINKDMNGFDLSFMFKERNVIIINNVKKIKRGGKWNKFKIEYLKCKWFRS